MRRHGNRAGFTLVEVIVVIVIIAILAAIGVPALTGYIDKAQDRKYIAEARDAMIASRTVRSELYAEGVQYKDEWGNDFLVGSQERSGGLKFWDFYVMAWYAGLSDDPEDDIIGRRISALAGREYWLDAYFGTEISADVPEGTIINGITLLGSSDSDFYTADGFCYGQATSNGTKYLQQDLIVTYKVDRINIEGLKYESEDGDEGEDVTNIGMREVMLFGEYNPNAGYEVYYWNNEE
jgi:prepilin-type N-terminal cleavage/methylation domain-containing protein